MLYNYRPIPLRQKRRNCHERFACALFMLAFTLIMAWAVWEYIVFVIETFAR